MSTPNDTIRAHLERAKTRHSSYSPETPYDPCYCRACGQEWPCPDFDDAIAALRILDEATIPTHGDWVKHRNYRLIADPGGRAAPHPTTTPDWPQPVPPPYPADDEGRVAP